jgi:hypothetical protein
LSSLQNLLHENLHKKTTFSRIVARRSHKSRFDDEPACQQLITGSALGVARFSTPFGDAIAEGARNSNSMIRNRFYIGGLV